MEVNEKPQTKLSSCLRKKREREGKRKDTIPKAKLKNSSNSGKKKVSRKNLFVKKTLKRALSYLENQSRMMKVSEGCMKKSSTETRVDDQVRLRCRQLPSVVLELRKSIMRQDWNEAATLVLILCHPGIKLYSTIIIRTCFLLLFNHPSSNYKLLENFIRDATGYILEEDINKFIRILFALRKSSLNSLESGMHARKTQDYKVTRDSEFVKL